MRDDEKNLSFIGGGKVSVRVSDILKSPNVRRQIASVKKWEREAREIRIAWHIGEATGHGLWFPATEENRLRLRTAIEAVIDKYGLGSHWLEERVA